MKFFKTKFLGLALVGLILGACSQMATYENADLMNEQAAANKAGFTMTPFGMGNESLAIYADAACGTDCFIANDPTTFFYQKGRSNFNPQIYVDYTVYQDATHIYYRFKIGASNSSKPTIDKVNGETMPSNTTIHEVRYALHEGWKACDVVSRTFVISRGGQGSGATQVEIKLDYNLFNVCSDDDEVAETCPESFSWKRDANDANTIIFEYTPHKSKIGAEIQITTPQITGYESKDGKTYTEFGNIDKANGGLRWIGDLVCGEEITFTIKFTPESCKNTNNLPANIASTFNVKDDMGGNKLTGEPIEGACVSGS
jgi:hypothetical protein